MPGEPTQNHARVEDEADANSDAEEWEDVDEEEDGTGEDEDEDDGEEEFFDHEDIIELAMKTNALLITLVADPKLDKSDPLKSPKPLLNTVDFVRRTYMEHIIPMLPARACSKVPELANPFTGPAQTPDQSVLDEDNYPALDVEKFQDAVGRNMLICMAILDPVKGQMVMGGRHSFSEHVLEIARAIAHGEEGEEELRDKYAQQGVDLSKH